MENRAHISNISKVDDKFLFFKFKTLIWPTYRFKKMNYFKRI